MKSFRIKFKPKTISRNELHFEIQKKVRGKIHKDKTKYDRKKEKITWKNL
jgi:hypothetical protein